MRVSGSSLRVDSARIAANPPTASGVITASLPPANMMSASSCRMIFKASPIACAPVAQAVAGAGARPLAPKRIETCPAARLTMRPGMKNGEIRLGPRSIILVCISSMSGSPPMPEPMITPKRSLSTVLVVELRVVDGHLRRGDGVVDEGVGLLDFLLLHPVLGVEPVDLAGDLAGERACRTS